MSDPTTYDEQQGDTMQDDRSRTEHPVRPTPPDDVPDQVHVRAPRRSERGEGVISTAIAVLIVAFLGIALWTGFDGMMNDATERTRTQVEQIGE
jgi:hypothetical protein